MIRGRTRKNAAPKKPKKQLIVTDNSIARDITSLAVTTYFVYDVEVFKLIPNSYNLEDSKYIQFKTYKEDSVTYKKSSKMTLRTVMKLVGAPKKWLIEQGRLF